MFAVMSISEKGLDKPVKNVVSESRRSRVLGRGISWRPGRITKILTAENSADQ